MVFAQFFNANDDYLNAEIKSGFLSLGVILFLVFQWSIFGVDPLIFGHVVGIGMAFGYMLIQMIRKKLMMISFQYVTWEMVREWRQWFIGHFLNVSLVRLVMIGIPILTQFYLAMFGPQIISANDYSLRLFQLVLVVAFIPLVTPFYTLLSETSLASNIPDMWSRFYRVTKYIFILFLVVITIIFFSSEWLIRLAFERGEFDATSTYITSQLFLYYCVGLFLR